MSALVAPLALLMALAPAALLLGIAYWRFAVLRIFTLVPAIACAVGVSLVILCGVVAASYGLQFLQSLRDSALVLAIPLAGYAIAIACVGRKGRMETANLVIGGAIGLVPLGFLALYVTLLSACSFGDCL
jgi:hypothetical protein